MTGRVEVGLDFVGMVDKRPLYLGVWGPLGMRSVRMEWSVVVVEENIRAKDYVFSEKKRVFRFLEKEPCWLGSACH